MDKTQIPDGTESEVKVLHSFAGYYIGTQVYDAFFGCWLPGRRLSQEYFATEDEAQHALEHDLYTPRTWL